MDEKNANSTLEFEKPKSKHFISRLDYEQIIGDPKIKSIEIRLCAVNLILHESNSDKTTIKIQLPDEKSKSRTSIPLIIAKDNTLLFIENKDLFDYKGVSPFTMSITISRQVKNLNIKLNAGSLFFDRIEKNSDVSMKTGTISGVLLSRNSKIRLGSGAINLCELQGNIKVASIVGELKLQFENLFEASKVNLRCDTGNIFARFPNGFLLQDCVKKSCKIRNTKDANVEVFVRTGKINIDMPPKPELPDDVLFTIFKFLDAKSLYKAGRACHRWNEVADKDCLWEDIYKSKYRTKKNHEGINWKQKYISRQTIFCPPQSPWPKESFHERNPESEALVFWAGLAILPPY